MTGNSLIRILWLSWILLFFLCAAQREFCVLQSVYATSEADICAAEEANGGMLSLKSQVFQLFVYSETFVSLYCITCNRFSQSVRQTDRRTDR